MTKIEANKTLIEPGSSNVFEDLGFVPEEAANLKIRADLMLTLRQYIETQGWTLENTAQFFNQTSDRIKDLISGEIDEFTIEQLVTLLLKVGFQVKVEVLPLIG